MKTNILKAIINIKNLRQYNLNKIYPPKSEMVSLNNIQNVGSGLETFIKDAFSDSFNEVNKLDYHSKYFSYVGNANNPPDAMLKDGDAIEIKKITSLNNQIQLNSSFPKNKLYSSDSLITTACRECENWTQKDMLYAIGIVKNRFELKSILFIYGDCFVADEEVYLKIKNRIVDTLREFPDCEKTRELGRINNVDPLGFTKLRVRGMWILKNPYKIFENIFRMDDSKFNVICLMTKEKFDSFPDADRKAIIKDKDITYEEVKIPNPNNPVKETDSVLIKGWCDYE